MARRIITARQQYDLLSPWRQAANEVVPHAPSPYAPEPGEDPFSPTPYWFHASPYELAPGTMLTPRGGKTTWNRFYNQLDPEEVEKIQNYVWLDQNINMSANRAYGRGHYVYRVEPTTPPQERGLAGGGHSTDSARIVELIGKTPKRQRGRTAGPRRRFNQEWQIIGGDYVPVDVISHYMQRKETGFGDEKSVYRGVPLSQQVTERGYEKPVELITDGKSGSVYDGHHRIDIAKQLGHTHVPVQVTWRVPDPVWGPDGAYGNKIEPWLKKWLTDMRGGRETVGRRTAAVDFNRYTGYPHIAHVHLPTDVVHYYRFNNGIDGTEKDDKYRAAGLPTLTESIAADGIQRPIEINTNGKYASIMDGHHRLGTARRLGLETVPVIVNYDPAATGPALKPVEEHLRQILADNPGPYRMAARRPTYGPDKLMGVNINDTLQDFTGQILSGEKTVETRNTKSLHPYVGRRIGILSTHDTRSNPRVTYLVGFATVGEPKLYDNTTDFDADYDLHRVAPGSDFHIDHPNCKHGVKWGYPMHDVKRVDPVVVDSTGIVTRDLTEHMHLAGWYHTSPRKLPVGTDLTPGGGRSSYDSFYRTIGEPDRKNHVWVEDDPTRLKRWHDIDADTNYHYRVEPDGEPRPYRDGDTSQGYVVPRARIVEELGPARRRRKGKLLYHRTTPENAAAINQARQFNPGLEKGQRPDAVFFSTNPGNEVGQARDYGDGLVTLNVPDHHFEDEYGEFQGGNGWLDDEFPSGEQHWAIPHQHLRPEWFVAPKEQS